MRKAVAAAAVLLAACGGGGGSGPQSEGIQTPPAPINGVGVYRSSFGFRYDASNSITGGGILLSDATRAMGGFCSATGSGFLLDYRYTRSDSATSGTLEVRKCQDARLWSGPTTGSTVDHASNDLGPADVFNVATGADGRAVANRSTYLEDRTERPLTVADFAGSYVSDGRANGGATIGGFDPVNVTITEAGAFTLVNGGCPYAGSISQPSERKALIAVTIPNCDSGETVSGLASLDGDSLLIMLTAPNSWVFYWGTLTRS